MKKYIGSIFRGMITALCAVMVLASCQDVLSSQENGVPAAGSGKGLVNLRLGDSAVVRTIMPEAPTFSRYELSFSKDAQTVNATTEQAAALASVNGAQVELEAGEWTATIQGYRSFTIDETVKEYRAATGSEDFTVSAGGTEQVTVDIRPLAMDAENAPQGIFTYAITLPVGVSEAELKLEDGDPINLLSADSAAAGSAEFDAGMYGLVITLKKGNLSAGVSEVVYIYPGLESTVTLDLASIEFAELVFLTGTANAALPAGVTPPYTVTAYSDAAHNTTIPNATASVATAGGTWFIKVPASYIGGTVYLTVEAASVAGYQASLGTAAITDIPANGKTGIVLTVPVVDKTALNTAITEANTAKDGVGTSADGKDKAPGTKWVTDTVLTTFNTAISTAQGVKDDAAATQNAVDGAVTTLNTAKGVFTGAIGTAATDKAALTTAISEATTAKTGVTSSATAPATGTKWVLPADLTTFNTAIAAAETVKNTANATQNAVDSAVSALNTAKTTFNGKVNDVTHGTLPDRDNNGIDITTWQNGSIATPGGATTIAKPSGSFTATVSAGYTGIQWYVNGVLVAGQTASSIVISAADYDTGTHRLGVTAVKDGKPYATEIIFTVEN